MLFEHDITVLTTHTVTGKKFTKIQLTHGVIHRFAVYFPPGCQHVVRCQIKRGTHCVWPTNPDGYIKGDALEVAGDEFFPVFVEPYQLDVHAWSESATYDHTITVRFWMKKLWQLMPFSDQMFNLTLDQDTS